MINELFQCSCFYTYDPQKPASVRSESRLSEDKDNDNFFADFPLEQRRHLIDRLGCPSIYDCNDNAPGLNAMCLTGGFGGCGLVYKDCSTDSNYCGPADACGKNCLANCDISSGEACVGWYCKKTCSSGFLCPSGDKCVSGFCCTPNCAGKTCGSDGCGGTCGAACEEGKSCIEGKCESCTPKICTGSNCGSDGCGGICTCSGAIATCMNGYCVSIGGSLTPATLLSSCTPNLCGAGIDSSSYFFISNGNFTSKFAYNLKPSGIQFNSSIYIQINYSQNEFPENAELKIIKYKDEAFENENFSIEVLEQTSQLIGENGGNLSLNGTLIVIPTNALNKSYEFTLRKVNISVLNDTLLPPAEEELTTEEITQKIIFWVTNQGSYDLKELFSLIKAFLQKS
jgi:hypothetical protein